MTKKRRQRTMRIPVMTPLRDEFGIQMHAALLMLSTESKPESFDVLAKIFNIIQVAIHGDDKRQAEQSLINDGVRSMNQIQEKVNSGSKLNASEVGPIKAAVNAIDSMLCKMDLMKLYYAIKRVELLTIKGKL